MDLKKEYDENRLKPRSNRFELNADYHREDILSDNNQDYQPIFFTN